jgi:hypothetical protein
VTIARPERLRLAELTSGVGAVVLGIGIGVLAADRLGRFGLPLLLIGGVVHVWSMFDKHRLERQASAPDVWWESVAYWACWGLLAVLTLGVMARLTSVICPNPLPNPLGPDQSVTDRHEQAHAPPG